MSVEQEKKIKNTRRTKSPIWMLSNSPTVPIPHSRYKICVSQINVIIWTYNASKHLTHSGSKTAKIATLTKGRMRVNITRYILNLTPPILFRFPDGTGRVRFCAWNRWIVLGQIAALTPLWAALVSAANWIQGDWGRGISGAPCYKQSALPCWMITNIRYKNAVGRGSLRSGGLGQTAPLDQPSGRLQILSEIR
jgi:hypothetical protein